MEYISKIVVKDEIVRVTVEADEYKAIYKIRLNDFIMASLSVNQQVTSEVKEKLESLHSFCYGYNKCLRKLAYQDKSEKEIRNILDEVYDLSESNKERIVQQLKSLGYLNDENVSDNQLYVDQNKLVGRKKTKYTLLSRGVDKDIVDQLINNVDKDEEIERAVKKAKALALKIKNKSYKEKMQQIRMKLVADGFENIDEIISCAQIDNNQESELSNLTSTYVKIRKKYENKYSGIELNNAIFKYLYSKGYSRDLIAQVVNQKEEDYED